MLKLCRRFQTEASSITYRWAMGLTASSRSSWTAVVPLLVQSRSRVSLALTVVGRLVRVVSRASKELSVVTEKCCTALICAAAPNLRGGAKEQVALEILMRYKNHVAPAVPRLLDITERLVDGRGLPPVRTAPAPGVPGWSTAPRPAVQAPAARGRRRGRYARLGDIYAVRRSRRPRGPRRRRRHHRRRSTAAALATVAGQRMRPNRSPLPSSRLLRAVAVCGAAPRRRRPAPGGARADRGGRG